MRPGRPNLVTADKHDRSPKLGRNAEKHQFSEPIPSSIHNTRGPGSDSIAINTNPSHPRSGRNVSRLVHYGADIDRISRQVRVNDGARGWRLCEQLAIPRNSFNRQERQGHRTGRGSSASAQLSAALHSFRVHLPDSLNPRAGLTPHRDQVHGRPSTRLKLPHWWGPADDPEFNKNGKCEPPRV